MSRLEDGKTVTEGLCMSCAKELGLPQVQKMMEDMGITDEELQSMEEMGEQLAEFSENGDFEPGGAGTLPPFIQNMFDSLTGGGNNSPLSPSNPNGKTQHAKNVNKPGEPPQKKSKFLDAHCTNLTERARKGKLDNIIGRDREIYRVLQILSRRTKNNPCLIGEPGVGKTAIAEGIAQKIAQGKVPFRLSGKELYLLDMTSLVAGTQFRGQFESRVKGLIEEVKNHGNIILFIDEVHTLVGTGDSEGSMSAANILKPALSRGEIQVIGATTFNEYRKNIEKDAALERRFQPVTINEPNIEDTIAVLKGIKQYYENHHKVKVSDNIVNLAVHLSERYITDRFLPDKAIDLLDEACACASIASKELTEYEVLKTRLDKLHETEKSLENPPADSEPDYEKIANVKAEISQVLSKMAPLEQAVANIPVTAKDIAHVIELWTGIPAAKIEQNELKKITSLEGALKAKIIGQDEAVEAVAAAIKRSRVRLSERVRPASFIFVGPTGVGKTELVKVLANELFDSVDNLIRVDMSEYMEKHAVSRLVGSPPGYIGHDDAGQLTEKVRRKPYSVVLFDEIEKAHPDVMNILLQILDEGHITDSHGRRVSFENTVIVMTSNAGSTDKSTAVGFNKTLAEATKEKAMKALSDFLRPEFLGRVDEIVVFKPLSEESLVKIAELMLCELKGPLAEQSIALNYDKKALKLLAQKAEGGKFAARDLRKVIRKEVEDKIANLIIDNADNPPSLLAITAKGSEIEILTENK